MCVCDWRAASALFTEVVVFLKQQHAFGLNGIERRRRVTSALKRVVIDRDDGRAFAEARFCEKTIV